MRASHPLHTLSKCPRERFWGLTRTRRRHIGSMKAIVRWKGHWPLFLTRRTPAMSCGSRALVSKRESRQVARPNEEAIISELCRERACFHALINSIGWQWYLRKSFSVFYLITGESFITIAFYCIILLFFLPLVFPRTPVSVIVNYFPCLFVCCYC